MIALANGFSQLGSICTRSAHRRRDAPYPLTLTEVRASVKNSRVGCCAIANAQPGANSKKISPRPVRVHKDASQDRESEPGNTIGRSARSTVERCGRRVHRRAKLPDKVVPWVLLLLCSRHPPRHERGSREGELSGHVRLLPLCSHRCKQYTPARRRLLPCSEPCRRRTESSRAQIVPSWDRIG